jgi:nitrogen-specific signal transduction histidine kinase
VELFTELADNLAYGVTALRTREERSRAEHALREAQGELAHVGRVMIMGELTASIAHEINQPLAAVVANANACFRWLANPTPNLDEARDAISRIVRDGNRASDVIRRIRALVQKGDTEKTLLDINEVIQEVVSLTHSEIQKSGVVLKMNLAASLPRVSGDRIQLQQVILNLVMNGIEAMNTVTDRPREMIIRSSAHESGKVLVAVQDSGVGIDSQNLDKIFDSFYTTKAQGMGMGLAISRSIVENHGGRLWAVANDGPGTTFHFTLLAITPLAVMNSTLNTGTHRFLEKLEESTALRYALAPVCVAVAVLLHISVIGPVSSSNRAVPGWHCRRSMVRRCGAGVPCRASRHVCTASADRDELSVNRGFLRPAPLSGVRNNRSGCWLGHHFPEASRGSLAPEGTRASQGPQRT